jgi:hypothetical protein
MVYPAGLVCRPLVPLAFVLVLRFMAVCVCVDVVILEREQ